VSVIMMREGGTHIFHYRCVLILNMLYYIDNKV